MVGIREAKQQFEADIFSTPGVHTVGVTIRDGQEVLLVRADREVSIPQTFDGHAVVQEVEPMPTLDVAEGYYPPGEFDDPDFYYPTMPSRNWSARVGRGDPVGTGTTGFSFVNRETGEEWLTSCWHVWDLGYGQAGDSIQNGGTVDWYAGVFQFSEIASFQGSRWPGYSGSDTVEVAWAQMSGDWTTGPTLFTDPMLDLQGDPMNPGIGTGIEKLGSTTGLTAGQVVSIDTTITVQLSDGNTMTVQDVIGTDNQTNNGDSGSPVWNPDTMRPVGMHFASGSTTAYSIKATNLEAAMQAELGQNVELWTAEAAFDPTAVGFSSINAPDVLSGSEFWPTATIQNNNDSPTSATIELTIDGSTWAAGTVSVASNTELSLDSSTLDTVFGSGNRVTIDSETQYEACFLVTDATAT